MPVVEVAHRGDERDLGARKLARAAPLLEFLGFFEDFHGGLGVRSQGSGVRSWSLELELENGIDIFFSRIFNAETQRRRGSWRVDG